MQIPAQPPVPPEFDPPRFDFGYIAILFGLIFDLVLLAMPSKWWLRILEFLFSALRHPP